ncbi:MAG: TIGR01777 family oxidoreductase [Myxococcaceae bacterium]
MDFRGQPRHLDPVAHSLYLARSPMPASAAELYSWHAAPGAFDRLMPPFARMRVLVPPTSLEAGAQAVLEVKVGPVAQRLEVAHTRCVPGDYFEDEQVHGPFRFWRHLHRMIPDGPSRSVLEDRVEYQPPFGRLSAGPVRSSLERVFAYRHAVTFADLRRHAGCRPSPMRVAVTGSTGFIGAALCSFLSAGGHDVVRLVRGAPKRGETRWDPAHGDVDSLAFEGVDAVVHLSGEPISEGRWTPERKRLIRDSRVGSTRLLVSALSRLPKPPRVLVSGSAIGVYGDRGDEELTETSSPGADFLAGVCREWEEAARPAQERGTRVVLLRTGVVLSAGGGALERMLTPFKLGAGGPLAGGKQWMSWVCLEDQLGAIHHSLLDDRVSGPVNVTAPAAVTQGEFARVLGKLLTRPAVAPVPAVALRALFGEMGTALLVGGQKVRPAALSASGFEFMHPELEPALRFALGIDRLASAE